MRSGRLLQDRRGLAVGGLGRPGKVAGVVQATFIRRSSLGAILAGVLLAVLTFGIEALPVRLSLYLLMALLWLVAIVGLCVRNVGSSGRLGRAGLLLVIVGAVLLGVRQAGVLWFPSVSDLLRDLVHPAALVAQGLGFLLFAGDVLRRRTARERHTAGPAILIGAMSIPVPFTEVDSLAFFVIRTLLSLGWGWLGYDLWRGTELK